MNFLVAKIRYIMMVTGVLTLTTVYTAIAPEAAMKASFYVTLLLSHGSYFLGQKAGTAVVFDGLCIVFAAYLLAVRRLPVTDLARKSATAQ